YSELEGTLRSGRIRYVPTLDRLVETLDRRAADDRVAMAAAGVDDVHEARSTGTVPDAVFPEIVMVATPLTPRQREKLTSLVSDLPRVAIAAITTDDDPIGDWHLAITGTNAGILEPIGLAITPQMLTPPDLDRILSVIYLATHEEATLDEPSPAAALTPSAPSLTVSVTPTPLSAPVAVVDQNDEESTSTDVDSHIAADEVTPSADDEAAAAAAAHLDVDAGEPADALVDVEDPDREAEILHVEPLTAVSAADGPTSEDSDAGDDETASRAIEAAAEAAASDDGSADDASEPVAAADDGAEELLAAAAAAASGGEAAAQPYIRVLGPVPDLDHARG
ncbi:MAG TPA: hypothetical protein PKA93_15595, partial [Arachnia sp.]|nr:hypothetical protein [Arachnia sp.]